MIKIWTETLPYDYWWKPDDYIGGTPEYVVNTAENLVKLGYEVFVYYDNEYMEHNGVFYFPRDNYYGGAITLSCNERPPKLGKKNISWTSKIDQTAEMYKDFDVRITMSNYHKSLFGDSVVVPLACKKIKPKKKKFQAIYTSSPDRGLGFLTNMWPEVYPETRLPLKTSYGASCGVTGVFDMGRLSEKEMENLYAESMFWLHPCQGIELFCISGYKAQMAGCIPIVIPNMALKETIKFGVMSNKKNYKSDLFSAIKNPPKVPKMKMKTWEDVTDTLDKIIENA